MAACMIEFRTLGTVQLRTADGRELRSVLTQPKRLALLSWLCVARPHGFHRRDTLLALFWPELDRSHARAALRKALHHLRRSLGPDVIVNRGMEEVRVRPESVCCDAATFADALESGDVATAADLYRGDLLEGFFLADTPEFERWLEEERQWLRARAAEAARAVAERLEAEGQASAAAAAARRAAALSFPDESAARRLVELLERTGDRAGAIAAYEEFTRGLRTHYELEPSRELESLLLRIRSRSAGGERDAGAANPTATPPSPPATPLLQPPARATRPSARRRLRAVPLAAIVLLGLAVAAAGIHDRVGQESGGAPETERIAVLPFSARTPDELAYLGAGIADLIDTSIDGVGPYRTVDAHALSAALGAAGAFVDPADARRIAERFGARAYVMGSVVEAGGRLRVRAALYATEGASEPVEVAVAERGIDDVFTLVDQLTIGLFGDRGVPPTERLSRLAQLTTRSPAALRAYLRGEALFRTGSFHPVERRFRRAMEAFQQAVAADSMFALAWYRLGVAAMWAYEYDVQREALARAVALGDRLSDRYRLLLRGAERGMAGDAEEAERLLRSVLEVYPDDVEARWALARVTLHTAALRGRRIAEARPALDRVLAIDSQHRGALASLLQIALVERDRPLRDSVVQRLYGDDPPLPRRASAALAWGDSATRTAILEQLARATPLELLITAWILLADHYEPRAAEGLHELLRERTDVSDELRGVASLEWGYLLLATGRVQAAFSAFDAAAPVYPVAAVQGMGVAAALPWVELAPAVLQTFRRRLERTDTVASPLAKHVFVRRSEAENGPIRDYQLALVSARLGDERAAEAYTRRLERFEGPHAVRSLARDLARDARATLDARHGRHRRALRSLESAELRFPAQAWPPIFYRRSNVRFLRASLLERLGHPEDALRWYASLAQGHDSAHEFIYAAPAHFARARILDALGRPREAAEQYAAFLELWAEPDEPLRFMTERAMARLRIADPVAEAAIR